MKHKELDKKTPQWFITWNDRFFRPVDSRSKRNEKLIFVIIAGVFGLNTVGNYYHIEIIDFIVGIIQAVGNIGG